MFSKKYKVSFEKDDVYLGLETTSKHEAIRFAGNKLVEAGYVDPAYIDSMIRREEILNTYINHGIAIPHGDRESNDYIIESGIVVCQYKEGIDYGDGKQANIVIGIAGKGNTYLRILADLAALFKDPQSVDNVSTSNDPDEVYEIIKEALEN